MSEIAEEPEADTTDRWSAEDETGEELNGSIYIIGCPEPQSIKIGFTRKDPRLRLKQLQTGNPSELILFGWYPANMQQERDLHSELKEFRLQGEWYRIDPAMNDILAGPVLCLRINNVLTGFDPGAFE